MILLKGSIVSLGSMYVLVVLSFWAFGIGNELQYATVGGAAIVAAVVLTMVFVLWGLPIHLVMQKLGVANVNAYSFIGAIPGAVFVTWFEPFGIGPLLEIVVQSIFCSLVGSVGSVSLWYVVVFKNR